MPEPSMVQLDNAQKQNTVIAETFDPKQVRLQALREITLIVEKCKAGLTDKPKPDQIISSSPITVMREHKDETIAIYNKVVDDTNKMLKIEGAPITVSLESAGNQFYFVAGRYEGESKPILSKGFPLTISKKEREMLRVPNEELERMAPDQLTDNQWSVLSSLFEQSAKKAYGMGFDDLFPGKKIETIRRVISPHGEDGKSIGFKYSLTGVTHKAAETLSLMNGACDDYSILYVACVKRLESEKKMEVDGIKLATVRYYDPVEDEDKKGNRIQGHANILQISMKNKDEKAPQITTFLVDFTYLTSSEDLDMKPEAITTGSDALKNKLLEHMNGERGRKEVQINEGLSEVVLYSGFVGQETPAGKDKYAAVAIYYNENAGELLVKEADGWRDQAKKQHTNGNESEAADKCGEADKYYEQAISKLSEAVKLGKDNGTYYGDAFVWLAIAYYDRSSNCALWSIALDNSGKQKEHEKAKETGNEMTAHFEETFKEAMGLEGMSSYALSMLANQVINHYEEAYYPAIETKLKEAIEKAPFRPELYENYYEVMQREGKKDEAVKELTKCRDELAKLGVVRNDGKTDAISVIDGLIGEPAKK